MPDALVLRPSTPRDDDVLLGWIRSPQELRIFAGPGLPWPLTRADVEAFRLVPGRIAFVAHPAGQPTEPVGHIELVLTEPGHARIARVLVDPERRGTGLGRALLAAVLDEARERGLHALSLHVYADNDVAVRTYRGAGFRPAGTAPGHADILVMAREPERVAERRAAGALDLARAGGQDASVEIEEPDPAWPERFAEEAARLAALVPGLALEHIGSTAVPGLPAKPIVDMMAHVGDLDAAVDALIQRAGYAFPEAYNATLTDRRWLCRPSAAHRTHHLHLVARPEELERHLRFRDALRRDAGLAAEYAALKRELAGRLADDREGYTAGKAAFVARVEAAGA